MVLCRRGELKMKTERLLLRRLCSLDGGFVLRREIALTVRERRRGSRRKRNETGDPKKNDVGEMASSGHAGFDRTRFDPYEQSGLPPTF